MSALQGHQVHNYFSEKKSKYAKNKTKNIPNFQQENFAKSCSKKFANCAILASHCQGGLRLKIFQPHLPCGLEQNKNTYFFSPLLPFLRLDSEKHSLVCGSCGQPRPLVLGSCGQPRPLEPGSWVLPPTCSHCGKRDPRDKQNIARYQNPCNTRSAWDLQASVAEPEPVEPKLFEIWRRSRNYIFS